jgi:putative ABC transport system permease protein
MLLWEVIKIGIRSLISHKLRSLLSILGVVFGVAAVIAMLSIGEGARLEALEQIRLMGTNNIIIKALPLSKEKKLEAQQNLSMGLTATDARRIKEISPLVDAVSPIREAQTVASFENRETNVHLVATTPAYPSVSSLRVAEGRFLREEDLEGRRKVCVLGWGKKEDLFPHIAALGKTINIDGQLYQVVGVLENRDLPKGKNLVVQARDINNDIYVPLEMDSSSFSSEINVNEISVRVKDAGQVLPAANMIKSILDRIHNRVNDYEIIVPQELLKQSQRTQRIFNIVMGSIAGISLVVGGIGIMNIMLAVITERTKEIGTRRALGANKLDILRQFLVETLVLTVAGGIIGIVLGSAAAKIINYYVDWRTVVSINAVFVSFFVSVLVGVIFGMYPAYKAANMNPIEALRYE